MVSVIQASGVKVSSCWDICGMIVIPQIWVKQLTASLEEYLGKIKIRDLALYFYCSLSLRTIHLLPRFQTISHLQRYFNPNTAALQLFIHINPDIRRTTLRNPSASSLKTMHYKKTLHSSSSCLGVWRQPLTRFPSLATWRHWICLSALCPLWTVFSKLKAETGQSVNLTTMWGGTRKVWHPRH